MERSRCATQWENPERTQQNHQTKEQILQCQECHLVAETHSVSSPFWETGQTKTPATKSRNQINDYNSLGQTCLSCIQLTSHSFKQNPNRSLMRGMTRMQGPLLLVFQHTERRQKGFLGGNLISMKKRAPKRTRSPYCGRRA